ncbi:MAG: hypothetical protein AAFR54_05350 [Planctomycetota bacterium]
MTERSNARRRAGRTVAASLALIFAVACGGDSGEDSASDAGASLPSSQERRSPREDAAEARRLLDRGRADLARPLIESLTGVLGVEGPLLLARLKVLEGDDTGWIADVERARSMDPKDPRPYAAAAELYAALGRLGAAKDEVRRGVEAVGGRPAELTRATGVLAIVTPGQAKAGLDLLRAAEREDEGLPFLGRPLGQAYLLTAKDARAVGSFELALERCEKSLEYDPEDPDGRRFRGEVLLAARSDFDAALPILREVHDEGFFPSAELARYYWSGGLKAQLAGRDDVARTWYLESRALGGQDVESGTAKMLLTVQAEGLVDGAIAAAREGGEARERASRALEEALRLAGPPLETYRRRFAGRIAVAAESAIDTRELEVAERIVDLCIEADRRAPETALVTARLHFELALVEVEAGRMDDALRHAKVAAAAEPERAVRWRFLGELERASGDAEAAVVSLAKAREFGRAAGEEYGLRDAVLLAECQVRAGLEGDAEATLTEAVRDARARGVGAGEEEALLERAEGMLRGIR